MLSHQLDYDWIILLKIIVTPFYVGIIVRLVVCAGAAKSIVFLRWQSSSHMEASNVDRRRSRHGFSTLIDSDLEHRYSNWVFIRAFHDNIGHWLIAELGVPEEIPGINLSESGTLLKFTLPSIWVYKPRDLLWGHWDSLNRLTIISCGLVYQATRTIDRYYCYALGIVFDIFKVRDSPLNDSGVANSGSQCHAEM